MQEGVKYNNGKLEMSRLFVQFPDALKAIMLSSTFGHIKYRKYDEDWLNFKRAGSSRTYADAGVRHQLLCSPEQEESGLPPIIHQAWNKMAELQKFIEEYKINIDELAKTKIEEWSKEYEI